MTEMKICPQCSEESESQFNHCWNCGTSLDPENDSVDQVADMELEDIHIQPTVEKASTGSSLGWSVFALLLFFPTGLMAVLYSSIAEIAFMHKKMSKAEHYASRAQTWRIITYLVFIVVLFFTCVSLMSY
ncbi:MAG: CD225/dispanin family protein [Planctomycetota bacterium]|nr:CD225/dispanin family protein [Planctomycetota bacterium]